MRKLNAIIAVFISMFIISTAKGQDTSQSTGSMGRTSTTAGMKQEILDRERQITDEVKNRQFDQFGSNLADDFTGVYATGIVNKDQEEQRVQSSNLKEIEKSDEKVVFPTNDVAILTYKAVRNATLNGQDVSGTFNVSTTFVRRNGQWVVVQHSMVKANE